MERERIFCKTGEVTYEKVAGITSLTQEQVSAEKLMERIRLHWGVENRLHYVRDVSFREDASKIRKNNGPQMMACLRNFVIGLLRLSGKVKNIAQACRRLSAKRHLSMRLIGI